MQSEDAKAGAEVELQEISPNDVAVRPQENPENSVVKSEQQPVTPALVLRRSTRATKSPQRYSPSLYYLLLTDGGNQNPLMRLAGEGFYQVGASHG